MGYTKEELYNRKGEEAVDIFQVLLEGTTIFMSVIARYQQAHNQVLQANCS